MSRRKKEKPDLTIFELEKKAKKSAVSTLKLAKEQENEKLQSGFKYFLLPDGKTRKLVKA